MARVFAAVCASGLAFAAGVTLHKPQTPDQMDEAVQSFEDEVCNHLTCRASSRYKSHINKTYATVMSWDITPAVDTDRVAVTIFQPPSDLDLFAYAIKANMHRLGPKWALQIFYGMEKDKEKLNKALGSPKNLIWTPITFNGTRMNSIGKNEANWFRMTMNFWDPIPEQYENVFIFESDSLVLRKDCVDKYIGYDLAGAPWVEGEAWGRKVAPMVGGNGGFTLRKRTTNVHMVQHKYNKIVRELPDPTTYDKHEDGEIVTLLQAHWGMNGGKGPNFPSREEASNFAVEKIFSPKPCGFHNPWEFLTASQAQTLLAGAEFD